jgi:hypothetical protein
VAHCDRFSSSFFFLVTFLVLNFAADVLGDVRIVDCVAAYVLAIAAFLLELAGSSS